MTERLMTIEYVIALSLLIMKVLLTNSTSTSVRFFISTEILVSREN